MEVTHIFISICLDKESVVYAYNGILFNLKKKEMLSFVTTWVNLRDIILWEMSQRRRNKYYVISSRGICIEAEWNGYQELGERGNREVLVMRYKLVIMQNE